MSTGTAVVWRAEETKEMPGQYQYPVAPSMDRAPQKEPLFSVTDQFSPKVNKFGIL